MSDERTKKEVKAPGADNYRLLEGAVRSYLPKEAQTKIAAAYAFAANYHKDQRRRSGEPYINHPVEVALILAHDLHMDEDTICAALMHDTVEDTSASLDEISSRFGESVAELVDGVTKLTSIEVSSMDEKQALNLRKMFLAMLLSSLPTAFTICVRWQHFHQIAACSRREKPWTCMHLLLIAWVSLRLSGSLRTCRSFG